MPNIQVKDKLITLEELGAAYDSITPANIGAVPIPTGDNLPVTGASDLNDSPPGWSVSFEVTDATARANAHMPFQARCYIYTVEWGATSSMWKMQMAFPWWFNSDGFAIRRRGDDGIWTEWAYSVNGIKGNAESTYRTGNVNLTPANIGILAGTKVSVFSNGTVSFPPSDIGLTGRPDTLILTLSTNASTTPESFDAFLSYDFGASTDSMITIHGYRYDGTPITGWVRYSFLAIR